MLEILKETTVWADGFASNSNHTYLLDGSTIIAYAKFGSDDIQVLKTPLKIDKRYRTFVKTNHIGLNFRGKCKHIDAVAKKLQSAN